MAKYNITVGRDVHVHTQPTVILCETVCPGHHYMHGAGESLSSGIEWCPGMKRANVSEMWDYYDDEPWATGFEW